MPSESHRPTAGAGRDDTGRDDAVAWRRRSAETHRLIKGRRWRVSDPVLDEAVRQLLVDELMSARRAVKTSLAAGDGEALARARQRVHDAKVSLGERGPRWWEPMSCADIEARADAVVRSFDQAGTKIDRADAIDMLRFVPNDEGETHEGPDVEAETEETSS